MLVKTYYCLAFWPDIIAAALIGDYQIYDFGKPQNGNKPFWLIEWKE